MQTVTAITTPEMQTIKALSIGDFCRSYSISRGSFYLLEKAGDAPKTIKLGSRRVIPVSALATWEQRKMAEAA